MITNSRAGELEVAKMFLDYINNSRRLSYACFSNSEENSDVDVYAKQDGLEVISIQVKRIDEEGYRLRSERQKDKNCGQVFIRDLNQEKMLKNALKKAEKYSDKEKITLLLYVEHGSMQEENFIKESLVEDLQSSKFKNIYFLNKNIGNGNYQCILLK